MHREYFKWFSPRLDRPMELLIFGHAGARVLVFPTRMGRFYDYENFGIAGALQSTIDAGNIQLFCVDSLDAESLYSTTISPRERIVRHMQYEAYIMQEVLPFSAEQNRNPFVISHGCSLGAYHALNVALRYPGAFGKVVALSGRYDLSIPTAEFRALFDGYYDDDVYQHTPLHYLRDLHDEGILTQLRGMEIIMASGIDDPFIGSNRELSALLWEKKIPNILHVWSGRAHQAFYWQQMVQLYL